MSKVVFVNPPLSLEDRYGVRFQSGGQTAPTGLACLAAMTRKNGYETAIIDAAALMIGYEETVRDILEKGFRYVGITAVTISISHAARLAGMLKGADKGITTIIGGPHLSAVPVETMKKYGDFDIGVIGEADYTIVNLLAALEEGNDLAQVKGLIFRRGEELISTLPMPPIMKMDELPKPAWDLLPELARYYCPPVHTLKKVPAGMIIASRGCPGKCIFCSSGVFGKTCRAHSAGYTFEMIKDLYFKYGIREIQVRDDNFIVYRKRMIELCEILKREKLDLVWSCAGRVDNVNPDLLKLMSEAGCWQIWYGIESGSQSVLDAMKKGTRIEQIEKAIAMTHKAGISPCGFFIIGSPTETKESMEETITLALKLPLAEAHFGFMTPLPGAELYNCADEFGTFDGDWDRLNGFSPMFVPHGLTADDLQYYIKKAFRSFYFRPRIVLSYLRKIRSWKHMRLYLNGFMALMEFLLKKKTAASSLKIKEAG